MKPTTSSNSSAVDLGRVLLIGLAAGLVATAVKTVCEIISPPRAPGVPSPLGNAINAASVAVSGHPVPEESMKIAEPVVHFLFGIAAGGVYALFVRKVPRVQAGYGMLFGFSFWLVAHKVGLPATGLSPTPAQMTLWEQGNEFVSHLIFGVSLEFVRRLGLRKWR